MLVVLDASTRRCLAIIVARRLRSDDVLHGLADLFVTHGPPEQIERSLYHYKCRRPPQADLKQRIKEIAETRVRYGYRRIHVLLRREGWLVNAKRVNRLYREMWWHRSSGSVRKSAIQSRSASIRDLSSCRRISTCGPRPLA